MVEHYLETKNRFILLRRWNEDISTLWCEQYFADVDIFKLTEGKYNCISIYRKTVYMSIFDSETMKTKRGEKIRVCYGTVNRATYVFSLFFRC